MVGSGTEQMFSLGGRWMKVGQKTQQGHTIDSYDPKTGFLNMSYAGVPLMPLKLQEAVVQDYQPMFAGDEREKDAERLLAMGIPPDKIQEILNPKNLMFGNSYTDDPTMQVDFDTTPYKGFNNELMEKIRENVANNPNLDYEHNGVVSFDEYQKLVKENKAQKGIYVVPYMTEDGNVDMQDFFFEGYEPSK